jgi:hypothetical protein
VLLNAAPGLPRISDTQTIGLISPNKAQAFHTLGPLRQDLELLVIGNGSAWPTVPSMAARRHTVSE